MVVQGFVQADSKRNIRAPTLWSLYEQIHWWLLDSPHKGSVIRKAFPCRDVMIWRGDRRIYLNISLIRDKTSCVFDIHQLRRVIIPAWEIIISCVEITIPYLNGCPSRQPNRIAHNLAAHLRPAHNPTARRCASPVVCNLQCRLAHRRHYRPDVGSTLAQPTLLSDWLWLSMRVTHTTDREPAHHRAGNKSSYDIDKFNQKSHKISNTGPPYSTEF